jgi:hypothetical protein
VIKGEKVNTKSISQIVQMHPEVEFAKTTGQAEDQLVTTVWSRDNRAIDLDGLKAFLNGRLRRHEMPVRLVQEYSNLLVSLCWRWCRKLSLVRRQLPG